MWRIVRDQSISIVFGALFLASVIGQAFAGVRAHNAEAVEHGEKAISLGRYVVSSDYGRAVLENWQSEYLQFLLFILATIWLYERGSPESPKQPGRSSDREEKIGPYSTESSPKWARTRGWRTGIYAYSLPLLMGLLFVASWVGQSLTGWTEYNADQRMHDSPAVSWGSYVLRPNFWEETLQNWQSEFLAIGSMAVFAIFLRARGSPESKKVGDPHDKTGTE